MPTTILPCANCQKPTVHRPPPAGAARAAGEPERLQCEICGTLREVTETDEEDKEALERTTAKLLDMIPAMSQKRAHSRLEEILYEYRSAIEAAPAFQEAAAAANRRFEIQDIKVQRHRQDATVLHVDFSYFALAEPGDELELQEIRVEGSAVASIDRSGHVSIGDVTAAAMPEQA